jgi:hypothetical protein
MLDQIVTAEIARQLHDEAMRTRGTAVWIVMDDWVAYPGKLMARLATMETTPYVLLADTLDEMRAALPPGLHHSDRTPADPGWPGGALVVVIPSAVSYSGDVRRR